MEIRGSVFGAEFKEQTQRSVLEQVHATVAREVLSRWETLVDWSLVAVTVAATTVSVFLDWL